MLPKGPEVANAAAAASAATAPGSVAGVQNEAEMSADDIEQRLAGAMYD
jgi:hypothetical protein